jgi:hypothetical protein
MPRTVEDVENYLLELDRRYESDGGTLVISGATHDTPIVMRVSPPIVVLRVKIGDLPRQEAAQTRLFRRLLQYNVSDLFHVSYGIDGDCIVLTGALELENLDRNELEAMLSDIDHALARHVPTLRAAAGAN